MLFRSTAFLISIAACAALGFFMSRKKPKNTLFFAKEGFIMVALSWIAMSIFGALPFVISNDIPNFVDALFETISGFTTTGASILTNVEALNKSCMFWRSFTHWIGGMGVFVLILAILPMTDSSLHILKAESPGPSVGKLVPKIRDTAKILYMIYIVMTLIQIVLLCLAKMPLFDALTISFGSAGTGGFGIRFITHKERGGAFTASGSPLPPGSGSNQSKRILIPIPVNEETTSVDRKSVV